MQLTHSHKHKLYADGYVKISGVIPQIMVDDAVRAINHSLGEGIDPAQIVTYRSRSFCPELQHAPVITDLLNKTPALAVAESAIGKGQITPVQRGQIALRFPTLQDPPESPDPHLDGMYSPHNGVPKGEIRNFTMLLGVALSDVTTDYAGNLTVWPGTHHIYEQYFRARGPQTLLEGMPIVALPEPVQLTARAGDIMLVHYQVSHTAAPNRSPYPRFAIYFRLKHIAHDTHPLEAMTNIWMDWSEMTDFTNRSNVE